MKKLVRWVSTTELFITRLHKLCQNDHEHEEVQGANTALSAAYPPKVADTICQTLLDIIKEEDFGSQVIEVYNEQTDVDKFNYSVLDWRGEVKFIHEEYDYVQGVECYYVDAPKNESDWRPLLEQALEILASKSSHAIFLAPEADLYRKIVDLVPWGIKSVQVAY